MDETWLDSGKIVATAHSYYAYDSTGSLSSEKGGTMVTRYSYDNRGNLIAERGSEGVVRYVYSGDVLIGIRKQNSDVNFTHDEYGRMTYDGLSGNVLEYNDLGLVRKVTRDGATLANYSYLADGTKLSALDGDGNGLVYRGPFVYRKSSNGSLTFESASFGGGLLTPIGALLYVKDYLGSVRAVVNARTGDVYKASKYLAYGSELSVPQMPASSLPSSFSLTLRAGYTGQADQDVDFGTGLTDFGARQYSPALRRWLTPDPLSEQAYGMSPYAFCNSNPVNYVDVDGEFPDLVWDLASIGLGVKSLVENVRDGNIRAAVGDGLGIAADALAAAVPVLPGGVGALRAGAKAADVADDVVDAAKAAGIRFKKFTEQNFRDNLSRLTGRKPDSNAHAHHIFPKGVKGFNQTSINPNDPRYGIWLDKDLHLGEGRAHKYNNAWDEFFVKNQNPTNEELFDQARKLMKEIYETEIF